MEYREIRYTVRARIERNEWLVSIHPEASKVREESSPAPVSKQSGWFDP
jgi:hypothetical protein